MSKVIVGMSGGVDSAVTAYLLKLKGYDVMGITLKNLPAKEGEYNRCCEIEDAQRTAEFLKIPYFVKNCYDSFSKNVIDPFVNEYLNGHTPNPCVICNRLVKWNELILSAKKLGADFVATGHYASVVKKENGRYTVRTAEHSKKDQTYMLYRLTQEQLGATLMPLGGITKEEVRDVAKKAGIPVAQKPDSQEICFVPEGHYSEVIDELAGDRVPPPGSFTNEKGEVLGEHKGITHYTVGQRKGLGIAMGEPVYVKEIIAEENRVVLSDESSLYKKTVMVKDVNFLSISESDIFSCGKGDAPIKDGLKCFAKVRYHHVAQPAKIYPADEDQIRIEFDEAVKSAAPGQSAVFYDEDGCVIGGGVIV